MLSQFAKDIKSAKLRAGLASALICEAVLKLAIGSKSKTTACGLVRTQLSDIAGGIVNEADVHPTLLNAAKELLG
jgi:hypothetical protein